MKKLLPFLFFCATIPLFAQLPSDYKPFPLFDDKPTWNELVKTSGSFSGTGSGQTLTYSYSEKKDFCGKNYSLVNINNKPMWLRNEGKKTYFRLSQKCSDKEFLLYDFDMKVGDSKHFPMQFFNQPMDSSLFTLKKIDSVLHFGSEIRRFTYDFQYVKSPTLKIKTMEIWEGVGSIWHPFFPLDGINRELIDGPEFILLCAHKDKLQTYQLPKYQTCSVTIIKTNDFAVTNNWQISPNPFQESIFIKNLSEDNQNTTVSIFDTNGKVLYQSDFQENININADFLLDGFYFIALKNKNGLVIEKMLKLSK